MSIGLILLGLIALLALYAVALYNKLVGLRNMVKNAWSQIDVQLQRRYDLIPNLIETVKGYMSYEKGTLEAVVNARNQSVAALKSLNNAGGPTEGSLKELAVAEQALKSGVTQIFALAEQYPELKANETMKTLQEELSTTENKIAFSRQAYNDQAMIYNTAQQQFPAVLVASFLGHHPADLFEIKEETVKAPVKVAF